MVNIPPHQRYSRHAKTRQISKNLLHQAMAKYGLNPSKNIVTKLAGGFQNANFLVQGEEKIVFRFYSTDTKTAQKEIRVHRFLERHSILVPRPLNLFEIGSTPVAVFEYIEGILLQDYLQNSPHPNLNLFNHIGQELAKIHQIAFKRCGFIGPNLNIDARFKNFSLFVRHYIETTLNHLPPSRLPPSVIARLKSLISKKWNLVIQTEPRHQLSHCDFNPKNILIRNSSNPSIAAILDWEFCLSGNGYIDLGNFFRFRTDYPNKAPLHFIQGYQLIAGLVDPQWLDIARLFDLGNMCSFLERPENYPRTFKTARAIIKDTLEYFGF